MNKEVIKKGVGSVALFGNDSDQGFENVTQEDTSLPYVRILGKLSAEVNEGDGMAATVATHQPHSPIIQTGKREGSKIRLPNGNYLEETAYYYVLMETKSGGMTPALITMKSSQLSVSKKWLAMMKLIQIEDGKGGFRRPPMHGVVYNLASALQQNNLGSWYGWSVTQDRIMGQEDLALYKEAKSLQETASKGNVQTKENVKEKLTGVATPF